MTLARKYAKFIVPQQFVEMLLHGLLDIKKLELCLSCPVLECGKFKLKKAFQSGQVLACTKKSEICATSTIKLIKTMRKFQEA